MNNNNYQLIVVGGLAILFSVFIGLFFQPGEIDLITPSHSDLYRYLVTSDSKWLSAHWLSPRPLSLVYVKIAGLIHQPGLFFLLIALPAFCFVTMLPYFVINAGLSQMKVLPLAAFFFVSLGSPLFYPHFQLDFGGMLSGFFAVLAASLGLKAIKKGNGDYANWWFLPILFSLLSVESKPTYSFLLLTLAFCGAVFVRGNRSKVLFIGVLLVLAGVFIKDKLLGSPFVASSDAASPYAIVLDPIKNIQSLAFYMKNAFTVPLAWATLLASIALLVYREWKLFCLFVALTISASMPMALLVNRLWDTYAWYSTAIVGVLIMVAFSRLLVVINEDRNLRNKVFAAIILFLISIGLIAHALSRHPTVDWTLANQHYNRKVLSALDLISGLGERKILLAGIQGPYHPLKNTAFVERVFPKLGKFDVLLRKNERTWNEMSNEQTNGIYLDKINWGDYSNIYVFDEKGDVVAKRAADEIAKMSRYKQNVFLFCGLLNENDFHHPTHVAKAIEWLNDNEEYFDSIELGDATVYLGETQPWIYFHLAKSYQAVGDIQKTDDLLNRALKIEPENPLFLSAMTENQSKIKKGIINVYK